MKVGDRYIIEIEEVIRRNGAPQIARVKGFNALVFDKYGLEKLEPYDDQKIFNMGFAAGKNADRPCIDTEELEKKAYEKGLNDAWKLVKRIESVPTKGGLTNAQIAEVFGRYWTNYSLYNEFSAEEALDLYRRWEDKQKQDAEIKALPPVNPQEKTGHWIWCVGSHKCSNCEEYTCFSHKELLRYCPNCGAKMVEPQESEDI